MATTTQVADLTAIVASIKRRQSLANRATGPQFITIGSAFRIAGDTWTGPVVVSPDALFLFRRTLGYAPVTSPPDLLGIPHGTPEGYQLNSTRARDLPLAILNHPDWPVNDEHDCEVIILPCEQVHSFTRQAMSRWIEFAADGTPTRIACETEQPALAMEFLTRTGWAAVPLETKLPSARSQMATIGVLTAFVLLVLGTLIVACCDWVGTQLGMVFMVLLASGFAALLYSVLHVYTISSNTWDVLLSGRKPGAS
jgi:hypothetical protein